MSAATLPGVLAAPAADVIASYPFKPYGYYNDLERNGLENYFQRVVGEDDRRAGVRTWTLCRGSLKVALAQLEPLPFDSRMLGRPAARLNWLLALGDYTEELRRKQQLLDWALEEARRRGIEHLTARVAADELSSIHALESRGFLLLDTILTFSRATASEAVSSGLLALSEAAAGFGLGVRLARSGDLALLRHIAASSFRYDRYHADPSIPAEAADRLHAEWVENSVEGFADAVLVAVPEGDEGDPIGFTTVKVDRAARQLLGVSIATIVLVATAPESRGLGVGRLLTRAAVEWCRGQGIERVEVGTQLRNVPACRLYAAAGFRLVRACVSLRWAGREGREGKARRRRLLAASG